MSDVGPLFSDSTILPDEPVSYSSGMAEQVDNVPQTGSGLFCEDCGTELTYSGRGRRPRKCPEHRRGGSKSTTEKTPNTQIPKGIGKIRQDLQEAIFTLGILVTPYDQYDGAVLVSRAPAVADTFAMLASRYPEFRKFLEKGGDGMMWFKVAMTLASVVIPIGAHHGIIPMDERMAYQKFVDPSVAA